MNYEYQPQKATLTRTSVSSLNLSSMAISDHTHKSSMEQTKQNGSTPSLISTDDEESRTESPCLMRRGGWGSAETRRAYTDLASLANAATNVSPQRTPPTAPMIPSTQEWGQFLPQPLDEDQEPMSF